MEPDRAYHLLEEATLADSLRESELAERLAVLGTFDPSRLKDGGIERDVFRLLCRRVPSDSAAPRLMLAEPHRIDVLAQILRRGGEPELSRVRATVAADEDTPLQRMLDAFVRAKPVPVGTLDEDELLASLEVWRWATEAVARAGLTSVVAIAPSRDEIESRLALLGVTRAVRRLAREGCIGREPELSVLRAYQTAQPVGPGLTAEPAMVVYGVGGVGKSTLVARFVMDLYERRELGDRSAWAYLDLDRPTLSSCEPNVLLADITDQLSAQFPDYRRYLQRGQVILHARGAGAGLEAYDTAYSYRERAGEVADAVRSISNGSLLVVLDTYEELERSQTQQARELYGVFSQLATEIPRFRLVVSGRSPATAFIDASRPDRQLHVRPLDEGASRSVLRFFIEREASRAGRPLPGVGDELAERVVRLVGGIPLTLRLAAQVIAQEGTEGVLDAAQRAHAIDRVRSELIRGFLYQRILNHITAPDPRFAMELRQVARASLVLRRVTPDHVARVLVPALDSAPRAKPVELFEALASEVALVQTDGGSLRLREELRVPALSVLKLDDQRLVRRVHELAVRYYSDAPPTEDNLVELAYHRLAAGEPPTAIDEDVLRKLKPAAGELPTPSAELLMQAASDPKELSQRRELARAEQQIHAAAEAYLRAGDLRGARLELDRQPERTAGTELNRLEADLAEAQGDLDAAAIAAERELDAASVAGGATRFAAAAVRVAGLHERRGEARRADAALRAAAESNLLSGAPELRLELLLNRMNLRERRGLDTEDSRWDLELDALVLMRRSDPQVLTGNTAMLRLVAAAFGKEEPERLQFAARLIGLGHEEDPRRVQPLIHALAKWDAEQAEAGRLARAVGLRVEGTDLPDLEQTWGALAGLGIDAGILLDKLLTAEVAPVHVREALRMIYLWWAVDEPPPPRPSPPPPEPAALEDLHLDWSAKETRQFEEILLTAYPTATDLRSLVDRAKLDAGAISWASSARRTTRDILEAASRSGRVDALITAVLEDPTAVSVHGPVREMVGPEWLRARGLPPK